MADYTRVLDDSLRVKSKNPARHIVVPAILVNERVHQFFTPYAKHAQSSDGCVVYVVVGGKTLRVTLEAL